MTSVQPILGAAIASILVLGTIIMEVVHYTNEKSPLARFAAVSLKYFEPKQTMSSSKIERCFFSLFFLLSANCASDAENSTYFGSV